MCKKRYPRRVVLGWCVFILLVTLLSGCGGAGSSPEANAPPHRPVGSISGHAVDAVIVGGRVSVYAYEDANKGALLGQGLTDELGFYQVNIAAPSQAVLLEIEGGTYTEEASGVEVALSSGQVLRAVSFFTSGEPLSVMITPATHLAAGLVHYRVHREGFSVENAMVQAASTVSTLLGVDIHRIVPKNVTDEKHASGLLDDGLRYGFFLAGISSWTHGVSQHHGLSEHRVYNSIAFSQMMYVDIVADGRLDGFYDRGDGVLSPLAFGQLPLSADVYRRDVARHILRFAGSEKNQTGLGVTALSEVATSLAGSWHPIFGTTPPRPLDEQEPVITSIDAIGQYYGGIVDYAVHVEDLLGVASVSFDLDGQVLGEAADPKAPAIRFDTRNFTDGEHKMGITAIDQEGNRAYVQFALRIDNQGPSANVSSALRTHTSDYTLEGTFTDAGVGVAWMRVQDLPATIDSAGRWSASVSLVPGDNVIALELEDALGNVFRDRVNVLFDAIAPNLSVTYSEALFALGEGQVFTDTLENADAMGFALYRDFHQAALNGDPVTLESLAKRKIPYYLLHVDDLETPGTLSDPAAVQVQMRYRLNDEVIAAWRTLAPTSEGSPHYLLPLVSEMLDPSWANAQAHDVHAIEISARDSAGNVTLFEDTFKVAFDVPSITLHTHLQGATVGVYNYAQGLRGALLGQCTTDQLGTCAVNVPSDAGPLVLHTQGGQYSAWGETQSVELGQHGLSAVVHFEAEDMHLAITPVTSMIHGLVEHKIAQGEAPKEAIFQAYREMAQALGFNPLSSQPINIYRIDTLPLSLNDAVRYGFYLAALSHWVAGAREQNGALTLTLYNDIRFAQLAFDDATSDGRLDGLGVNANGIENDLSFGFVLLDANTYRQGVATAMLSVANSPLNMTQFDLAQVSSVADALAMNSASLYGPAEPVPLDNEGPQIAALFDSGAYYSKNMTLAFEVSDLTGVATVKVDVNGTFLRQGNEPISLDTTQYTDGQHRVGVEAVDHLGNVSYRQFTLNVDNTAPSFTQTSDAKSGDASFVLEGTYQDTFSGVEAITLNGERVVMQAGYWSHTVALTPGMNAFLLTMTDQAGNVREDYIHTAMDNVPPSIETLYSSAKYMPASGDEPYRETLGIASIRSDAIYLQTDRIDLDDITLTESSLNAHGVPFYTLRVSDPAIDQVVASAPGDLIVELQVKKNTLVQVPWRVLAPAPSSVNGGGYIIPLVADVLGDHLADSVPEDQHQLEVRVSDEVGNSRIVTYGFRLHYVVPPLQVNVQDRARESLTATPFGNRASLHDMALITTAYEMTNPSDKAIRIKLEDDATHTLSNEVESAIREHQARLVTQPQWRVRPIHVDYFLDGLLARCSWAIGDWGQVSELMTIAEDGQSWSTMLPSAMVSETVEAMLSDTPDAPDTTPWVPDDKKIGDAMLDFAMTAAAYDGVLPAAAPINGTDLGEGIYVAAVNDPSNNINCATPLGTQRYFEQRNTYAYQSESGYPRNVYTGFTEQATFTTQRFEVLGPNGPIMADNGWYMVPEGARVEIRKIVKTPTLSVYNDRDVENDVTFSSYTQRHYDKKLTWSIDSQLTIIRAHVIKQGDFAKVAKKVSVATNGVEQYVLGR